MVNQHIDEPGIGSAAVPQRGEGQDAAGVSGDAPETTIRVRVTGGSPDGDDPAAVVSGHPGVSDVSFSGGLLSARLAPPGDRATLADFLRDAGFEVADA